MFSIQVKTFILLNYFCNLLNQCFVCLKDQSFTCIGHLLTNTCQDPKKMCYTYNSYHSVCFETCAPLCNIAASQHRNEDLRGATQKLTGFTVFSGTARTWRFLSLHSWKIFDASNDESREKFFTLYHPAAWLSTYRYINNSVKITH